MLKNPFAYPRACTKCDVSLRVIGDRQDKEGEIRREFVLLESILNGGVNVRIVDSYKR